MVLGEGTRISDVAGGAEPATKRAKSSRTNNNKRSAAHLDNAINAGTPHHVLFSQVENMVEDSDEDEYNENATFSSGGVPVTIYKTFKELSPSSSSTSSSSSSSWAKKEKSGRKMRWRKARKTRLKSCPGRSNRSVFRTSCATNICSWI